MTDHHTWTTHSTATAEVERAWFIVDASGKTVGRLASSISQVLTGKHKPAYTRHIDTGDFVIVINAEKVVFTGRKWDQKKYHNYSGYKGGLRSITAKDVLKTDPTRIMEDAVWGMLPQNRLGRAQLSKLKIYAGGEHPHAAQTPVPLPAHI